MMEAAKNHLKIWSLHNVEVHPSPGSFADKAWRQYQRKQAAKAAEKAAEVELEQRRLRQQEERFG